MTKEYIERQAPINAITKDMGPHRTHDFNAGCARAVNRIIDVPAADVVEVVRCRECTFWDTSWNPGVGVTGEAHYCPRCHLVTLKDSFCSGACRKDGGQDNG